MRRSGRCKEVFRLANFFAEHFGDYQFNGFTTPADEPCLALAMAVQNCRPVDILEGGMVFAPSRKQIDLDIMMPKAVFRRKKDQEYNVKLVHWSNYRTKLALYRFEAAKMNYLLKNKRSEGGGLLYQYRLLYYFLCVFNVGAYVTRIGRKLRKTMFR